MMDFLISALIVLILSGAIYKIYKDRKAGVACPGCPHSKSCSAKCNCENEITNIEINMTNK